jgi:hypothetical protein
MLAALLSFLILKAYFLYPSNPKLENFFRLGVVCGENLRYKCHGNLVD